MLVCLTLNAFGAALFSFFPAVPAAVRFHPDISQAPPLCHQVCSPEIQGTNGYMVVLISLHIRFLIRLLFPF